MSEIEPKEPYIYQPYGSVSHPFAATQGRLWGVAGISLVTEIKGLTKAEAEVVLEALKREAAMTELAKIGQEIGDYDPPRRPND